MYCKKCGKFINNDDDYCSDCAPKEASVDTPAVDMSAPEPEIVHEPVAQPICTPAEPIKPKREGRVMDGFGHALTSAILGVFSFSLAYVAYLFLTIDGSMSAIFGDGDVAGIAIKVVCAIYILIAIGLGIPSLVMGIKSIKLFRAAVKNKRVKPIPALALGIYGTYMSGTGFIMAFAAFLMLISSLLMRF